jgi:nitrogen PTS system EIIA component
MTIEELLSPAEIVLDVRAADKPGVLRHLSARLAAKLGAEPDAVHAAMVKREELGSTGMGGGVAIPHARVAQIRRPAATFARLKHKVPFEAVDGEPVDLVCMLAFSTDPQGEQLNCLAMIARALRNADLRARLRTVRDQDSAFRALVDAVHGQNP